MLKTAFVPMAWVCSDLSGEALRTLIMISSFADRTTGECWPSNRQLVNVLRRSERAIRMDLAEIQKAGLISIEEGAGKNRKFRIESEEWFQNRGSKRPASPARSSRDERQSTRQDCAGIDETTRQNTVVNPAKYGRQPGKIMPGANKNYIQEPYPEQRRESESASEESKPGRLAEDISLSLSDLGRKPEPIPPKLKRMATDLGAECWLGEIQFQEIPFDDWRIEETLIRLKARGGKKGSSYIWKIFRDLPEKRPNVVNGYQAKPKPPPGLLGAEAGLAMAKRMISTGEATQDDVDRYQRKVEDIKRKAGIQ